MVAPPPAHLHYGGVPLPDPITTNPPTASDIAQAEEFSRAVIYQLGQIVDLTAEEVAEAKKYEFRVLKASTDARAPLQGNAPPWLQGLVDRIDAVNARVGVLEATIDARFNEVRDELRAIKDISVTALTMNVKDKNLRKGNHEDFEEVPFPDGTFPWDSQARGPRNAMVNLPPLRTIGDIIALSTPQTYGYFRGYYPNQETPGSAVTRKRRILIAIGRPDLVRDVN